MVKINLKNIVSAKSETGALVLALWKALNADLLIEDSLGNVLMGNPETKPILQIPIQNETEIIGLVKGDEKVSIIATMLNLLVAKEVEKKKLGHEVLTLYQEVNLIFNFSEKLADTIGQNAIAAITLEEAMRLIKSDNGLLVLRDEQSNLVEVMASAGKSRVYEEKMRSNVDLLQYLSHNGQSEIVGDVDALKEAGLLIPEVQSLIYASLKVKHRVMGAIILSSMEAVTYSAADLKFLITLSLQSSSALESAILYEKNIQEARNKEEAMRRIYEVTNKFVPHEFIRSLGRSAITDIRLGDQVEKIVTVLFMDIRDYTTLSEHMSPEENFSFVCSFNERMGPIIRQYNGFINQYLGDAIMAIFPGNPADALQASIKMFKALREFNVSRVLKKKTPIKIGIGLHTGPLIMGITGDINRMDATTIADTVNTASRLESLTKVYKGDIILSEASLKSASDIPSFLLRPLGMVQLKGKKNPIGIYECFNGGSDIEIRKKTSTMPLFEAGINAYFNKAFLEASDIFQQVLAIHPEDLTAKLFLENANRYVESATDNWTGVEEMKHK